ncbi:hypothetical protein ARTHRO9V_150064 [Arthrobacter sp. 9V]|nr:hypothetical protein ARTHRO9V_150064 [Arthrobacter sp. 9V]
MRVDHARETLVLSDPVFKSLTLEEEH